MTNVIPTPSTANAIAITTYDVVGVSRLRMTNAPAMIASPDAITRGAPKRAMSVALRGEKTMNMIGNGRSARPASSGE